MSKDYATIGQAYGNLAEKVTEIRDRTWRTAVFVFQALKKKGAIPDGSITYHHPDETAAAKVADHPTEAIKLNEETGIWEVGYLLLVRRGKDIFPEDPMKFVVKVAHTPNGVSLRLGDTGAQFTFDYRDSTAVNQAIDNFAEQVLEAIHDYYERALEAWSNGSALPKRIFGFANPE